MLREMQLALLTVLFLTACSNKEVIDYEYSFTGESENWVAEYYVQGTEVWGEEDKIITYSNEDSDTFTLKYKGTLEELASVKTFHYSYKANSRSSDRNEEFGEPLTEIIFTDHGRSTGAKVREDAIIQVHVKWDDAEESFDLLNRGK